ncbi:MAG: hypothetical protein QG673_624 [Pseudomonadota bacterium]|nr:hypothetical protein [Pseudomonadota bacterium]
MSLSGTYAITVKTPLGERNSTLNLIVDGSLITGTIVNDKGSFDLTNGTVNDHQIEFDTVLSTMLGELKAHIQCTIIDDSLTGMIKLSLGEFQVIGHKTDTI